MSTEPGITRSSRSRNSARGLWPIACSFMIIGCTPPTPPTVPGPPPMPGMPTAPDAPTAPGVPGEYDQAMQYIPKGGKSGGGVYVACKPPPLEIFVQADAQLNPNEKGQPMPVEVR